MTKKRLPLVPKEDINPLTVQTVEEAPNAVSFDEQDKLEPIEVESNWTSRDNDNKLVYVQSMLIAYADTFAQNNPVIAILLPKGAMEDFEALWTQQVNLCIKDEEQRKIYFPEIKEHAQVADPTLYTQQNAQQETLYRYFLGACQYSGVDPNVLGQVVGLDLATLKAFYLVTQILPRSIIKQLEGMGRILPGAGADGSVEIAPGATKTKSGLIVPSSAVGG